MDKGLRYLETDKFWENGENQDIITRYINFYEIIIKKRNQKYLFSIFNTNKHNKSDTHWWIFMDIRPRKKNLLLFDSLGLERLKSFILDNDENIIDALFFNIKKC